MKTVQEPTQAYSDVFVFRPYDEGAKRVMLLFTVYMIVPPFAIPMVAQNQQPDKEKAIVLMILLEIMMFFAQCFILSCFRITLIFQPGALRVISGRRRNDRCIPAETFSYAYIVYQYNGRWIYVFSPQELSSKKVQHIINFRSDLRPWKNGVFVIPGHSSRIDGIDQWIEKHIPHVETWG